MAYKNIVGFEAGDLSEAASTSGTVAVDTTTKRTGAYSLKMAASGSGVYKIKGLATNGTSADLGLTTGYAAIYFYVGSAPASGNLVRFENAAGTTLFNVKWVSGVLTLEGFSVPSGPVGTPSTGAFHRLELKGVQNGTCEAKLDGGTAATVTGDNVLADTLVLSNTSSVDHYFDDVAISDSAYPGAGQVNILKPNATGTYSDWTNGAGTSPTNVAEVPHNSDTDYITSSTNNDHHSVNMDSSATGGVSGTIATVKHVNVLRYITTAATARLILKSGAQENTTTNVALTTTYTLYAKLYDLDIVAGNPAWTVTAIDAIECGPQQYTTNGTARCTAIYAMVWCTGLVDWTPFIEDDSYIFYMRSKYNYTPLYTASEQNNSWISSGALYLQAVAGSISVLTGSLTKKTLKSLSGSPASLAGELSRFTTKSFSGVAGALTGAIQASKVSIVMLAGTMGALSGTIAKMPQKALDGSISAVTGTLSRMTQKALSGASGALSGAISRAFPVSLSGAVGAISGGLTKITSKSFSGTITGDGSLVKKTLKALAGSPASLSGTLATLKFKIVNLSGSITMSGGLISVISHARVKMKAGYTTVTQTAAGFTTNVGKAMKAGYATISKMRGGRGL